MGRFMNRNELVGLSLALCISLQSVAMAVDPPSLRQGIANYNRGYIAKALPLFQKAAQQAPGNPMAHLWLARAYQKQGGQANMEHAQRAYQQVLSLQPDNVEALSNLGEMWSWNPSRRAEAIILLQRAHDLKPSDAGIARKLADALFWDGRASEALQVAAPIAGLYQKDKKWLSSYAQMLTRSGHADEALDIYQGALATDIETNLGMRLYYADALMKAGQSQKAQAVFEDLSARVEGSPLGQQPDFMMSMAGIAFDLGLYAESVKWDQMLPDAMQRQKDVQLRTARALTRVFRVPEAIERFQRLYEAGLLSADEKLEYADYLRQVNVEEAALPMPGLVEKLYKEALEDAPGNGDVALRLARLYGEDESRFEEAVVAYRHALTLPLPDEFGAQKEFLDFVKSNKADPARVEQILQEAVAASPDAVLPKAAYAEFLSWQGDRRAEAMRMYVEIAQTDRANAELWESKLEEVLKWHKPTTDLIPVYQEVVNLYPDNKTLWLTVARAYRDNPDYFKEAVETYGTLVQRYPDDGTIKKEWLGVLLANERKRAEIIRMLEKMTRENPADLDIAATYGKLLSYDARYGQAMDVFNNVLSQNPEHREALIGKGYTLLWRGLKYEARDYLQTLRAKYPDDVDIAIALAQAEKLIGRYDEALKIIQQIKPLMNPAVSPDEAGALYDPHPDFIPVDYRVAEAPMGRRGIYDFSILPYSQPDPPQAPAVTTPPPEPPATQAALPPMGVQAGPASPRVEAAPGQRPALQFNWSLGQNARSNPPAPVSQQSAASPAEPVYNTLAVQATPSSQPASADSQELARLRREIQALTEAANSVKALQQSSRSQLDKMHQRLQSSRDIVPGELDLQPELTVATGSPTGAGTAPGRMTVGTEDNYPVMGTYAAIDYDTNPLLSGLGRFRNDELGDLERNITHDLRPIIRAGYLYSIQDGEPSTSRFANYGFPNQLSFSLTPQVRVRGGVRPTRYYIPSGRAPDPTSNWGTEYGIGATVKYWDRLTLDGDIAVTHFTQTRNSNLTFQAQAEYAFNDYIRAKLGARRLPPFNSLLSVAGQKPENGAYAGDVVGQARENTFYAELDTNPFHPNLDLNLGYEWGFVTGHKLPTNFKNQAFLSAGYTWKYHPNHSVRLGYEFLYFGYSKNATNGYFDLTEAGVVRPLATTNPVVLAHPGYDFGGYFSPRWFILNAGRLDFRGSLFNKFLEYKFGGSLGGQAFGLGHGIDRDEPSDTSLASAFDANIILNFTDWLSGYGNVDFLDAGGQFNRWRFGGGLILRPRIDALSPMFGRHALSDTGSHGDAAAGGSPEATTETTPMQTIPDAPAPDAPVTPTEGGWDEDGEMIQP